MQEQTITLSAALMAHPDRREQVQEILARLDRPVEVTWDRIHDLWDTGRRAMLAYDPAADYHVVIQDDVLVPRDLLAGLEKALTHVPAGHPVCGYIGRLRPWPERMSQLTAKAARQNASWVVMPEPMWGPLICVPTACIEEMVQFCDGLDMRNYDLRVSRYFKEKGVDVWFPWPSIVDHADGPSLIIGRSATDRRTGRNRIAYRFCGEETSLLDVDFSGPVVRQTLGSLLH